MRFSKKAHAYLVNNVSMLNLQVTIDQQSGFCFGVVYAIRMAEEMLEEQDYLYCLGDIVHNDEEVKRLEAKGLRIINHQQLAHLHGEKVLIRAHGEPPSTYRVAMRNHIELVDASCPVVLKLQNRIKNSYDKGETIYLYGKQGHAEVIGLLGQTDNQAVVFGDAAELDGLPERITLYSQTTQSTGHFYEIVEQLSQAGVQVEVNDTICRQVSNRHSELQEFAARFDKIIFVSGSKSSNGKVLYKACKNINQHTYFVSRVEELLPAWFEAGNTVGICGATSTPMWLMEQIRDEICTY